MSEVILNVQVFPNLAVAGEKFTVTKVMASADCGEVGYGAERMLVDDTIDKLNGITREDVIAATKREVLQELTVTLVAKGVL